MEKDVLDKRFVRAGNARSSVEAIANQEAEDVAAFYRDVVQLDAVETKELSTVSGPARASQVTADTGSYRPQKRGRDVADDEDTDPSTDEDTDNDHYCNDEDTDNDHNYCTDCEETFASADALHTHKRSIGHLVRRKHAGPDVHVYALNERNNVGYRMLREQGWTVDRGLGAAGEGRKLPVPTRLKTERLGVGFKRSAALHAEITTSSSSGSTSNAAAAGGPQRKRITHTAQQIQQAQEHGRAVQKQQPQKPRSRQQIAQEHEREKRHRQALLDYMHRPSHP